MRSVRAIVSTAALLLATVGGILAAGPALAATPTVPADKPELEYLKYWRLDTTLPKGGTDYTKVLIVGNGGQPDLQTYTSNQFRVVTGGGVSMRAQYGGAVTSTDTAFSRTELREMASSTLPAAWACTSKAKEMTAQVRVKVTPKNRPVMSLAQIHDSQSDVLEVQYRYDKAQNGGALPASGGLGDKGTIIASWNGGATKATLDPSYVVGDTVTVTVKVNGTAGVNGYPGAGRMAVSYSNDTQGRTSTKSEAIGPVKGDCFFKAGNYHQACTRQFIDGTTNTKCDTKGWPDSLGTWENQASATDSSELILYKLTVTPKG